MRRRIASFAILSLLLSLCTATAFAGDNHDRNNHRGKDNNRKEWKYDKKDNKVKDKKYDRKKGRNERDNKSYRNDKSYKHNGKKYGKHKEPMHYRPMGHPVQKHPMYGHQGWKRPSHLDKMIRHACRGGKDVSIWQVDYDTYAVRYRKGHKWYTQYIYPYTGVYGRPSLINVNWSAPIPWISIPPLQININL